jgi:hypothetical protein
MFTFQMYNPVAIYYIVGLCRIPLCSSVTSVVMTEELYHTGHRGTQRKARVAPNGAAEASTHQAKTGLGDPGRCLLKEKSFS